MKPSAVLLALALFAPASCRSTPPTSRYALSGQILAVNAAKQELTIKHGDIAGLMPAMTMTYAVASTSLMAGRAPGETITATLEVTDSLGRLVAITHTGSAPLPEGANVAAIAADLLEPGDAVPDVALIDQTNRRRSLAEWKGDATVLTFIYTRCPLPNFCPLMDQNFEALQKSVRSDAALTGHVRLVTVTIDPDYDTPAVLAARARHVKADPAIWTFLTGDRAAIEHLSGEFGVGVLHDGAPGTLTHNLRTAVIGPDGRLVKIYSGNDWTPGDVLTDLRALSK